MPKIAITAEMLAAQHKWLPQFKGKKLTARPAIKTPKNVKRIEVPVDSDSPWILTCHVPAFSRKPLPGAGRVSVPGNMESQRPEKRVAAKGDRTHG